jgi:hypothetical protein
MTSSGRGTQNVLGLAPKDRVKLKHISRYRRLRLTFNCTLAILALSVLAIRWEVFENHPNIAIAAMGPLLLLMLIAGLRITLYPCPYCESRLGWRPYYRTRCKECNDAIDLER